MKWFTADDHLGHEGVLEMSARRFCSIEEHDDHLIGLINLYVKTEHQLFILGDFAWRNADSYADRIKCKNTTLIWGNHDKPSSKRCFKHYADVEEIKIEGVKCWLSHYPHAIWPSSHYGAMHLYGHLHLEREQDFESWMPGRRSMDVGVDNARTLLGEYRPFSELEIAQILLAKPGHDEVKMYMARQWLRNLHLFASKQAAFKWGEDRKLLIEDVVKHTGVSRAEILSRLEYLPGGAFPPTLQQDQIDK